MKSAAQNSSARYARRLVMGLTAFVLLGPVLAVETWSQTQPAVTLLATEMGRSSDVMASAEYVTIYGNPRRKAYVYKNLGALSFHKFHLRVEAAGESGNIHWPELGVALQDTINILKKITVTSTSFQSYDLGIWSTPPRGTLYLVFLNDAYGGAADKDVNLKIRRAVLTPATQDTVIVRGTQLTLSWNPNREADLKGYRIYHSVVSGKYLNDHIEVSRSDTAHVFPVTLGCDYFYAVAAYDTAGNQSALSPEIMARVRPAAIVATPDLNHDDKCDNEDIKAFQRVFALTCTHTRYNAEADFNGDCKIDGQDQTLFLQKYKSCSK